MAAAQRVLTLLVATALALAGCTGDEPTEPASGASPTPTGTADPVEPTGGTLRIGLSVDPASIDPRFVADDEGELVVDALFDPLVRLDDELRVVPAAASRYEVAEDGRVFTFHLRRNATFHDGRPVTAEDFVRSFRRIADGTAEPPSFLAFLLAPVEGAEEARSDGTPLPGVEAIDEHTLEIRLSEPRPGFLRTLTDPSLVPLPPGADEDPDAFAEQPIGNGPFAMAEPREPGSFLRLTRAPEHRTSPRLDEVLFVVYGDDPAHDRQWEDLLDGQLQVAEIPPDRLDDARERFGASSDGYSGPGLLDGITSTVYLYGFDTTQPPFDDVRVRRAVSRSIDRTALAEEVLQGTRVPAEGIVPPPLPGSQRGACDHCRHDPDAARQELAAVEEELGEELGPLTLTHSRGRTHAAIAERMADDLRDALEVEVEVEAVDLQPFVQQVRAGEVPLFRLGWESTVPDAGAYLEPLFHSEQVGADNLTGFADESVDELLDAARTEPDEMAAAARYREAERAILAQAPVVPLLWYRHGRVVSPEVRGLRWNALGRVDLARVWLDPAA